MTTDPPFWKWILLFIEKDFSEKGSFWKRILLKKDPPEKGSFWKRILLKKDHSEKGSFWKSILLKVSFWKGILLIKDPLFEKISFSWKRIPCVTIDRRGWSSSIWWNWMRWNCANDILKSACPVGQRETIKTNGRRKNPLSQSWKQCGIIMYY